MEPFYVVEFTDYQNLHDFLIKLYSYEIVLFEEDLKDFPFHVEILSRSHYKDTKQYLVRINNLLAGD